MNKEGLWVHQLHLSQAPSFKVHAVANHHDAIESQTRFRFWLATMLKRMSGLGDFKVTLLVALPNLLGLVAMQVNGWHSDRTAERHRPIRPTRETLQSESPLTEPEQSVAYKPDPDRGQHGIHDYD